MLPVIKTGYKKDESQYDRIGFSVKHPLRYPGQFVREGLFRYHKQP